MSKSHNDDGPAFIPDARDPRSKLIRRRVEADDDVFKCLAELKNARRGSRAPTFADYDASVWVHALDILLLAGRMDVIEHGVRHLHAAHPNLTYATNLCMVLDRLPVDDGATLPFQDDSGRDVQVVRRENAQSVLILFCDAFHRLGMPLKIMHRWFGRLPASLIYLRDFRRQFYLAGVSSLGADRPATEAALRELARTLGGRRIACCGPSAGAYGGLLCGLELGATGVLALGGPTNLSVEFNAHLRTAAGTVRLQKAFPGGVVDLRRAYTEAARPPRATVAYCDGDWDDRLQAEYLSGLPSVKLKAVAGCDEHNVIMALIRTGQFEPLLTELLAG